MRLSREETRAVAFIAGMIALSILGRWADRPLPVTGDLAAIDIDSLALASERALPKKSKPKKATSSRDSAGPSAGRGTRSRTVRAAPAPAAKPHEMSTNAAAGSEPVARVSSKGPPSPVDLNSATVADLERIPRIGPVLAARIIAYRDSVGRFADINQLVGVKGVGPAMLERLRPYVRVP